MKWLKAEQQGSEDIKFCFPAKEKLPGNCFILMRSTICNCHFALVLWPILTKDAAEHVCATRSFIYGPRGRAAGNNFCMPKLWLEKKKPAEQGLLEATAGVAVAVLIVCCGALYKGCWFQQCRVISAFSSQRLYSNQKNSTRLSNTNKSPVNSSESLHPITSAKKWKKRGLWRRWMTFPWLVATLSFSATDELWKRFFFQRERIQCMKSQQRILVLKASQRNEKRFFLFAL